MLKVVFFGMGGDFSAEHLRAIVDRHHIAAVVRADPFPRGSRSRRKVAAAARALGIGKPDALTSLAGKHGIPCWPVHARDDTRIAERIEKLQPDVICLAGYRWILPPALLALPSLGTINSHPSLLPRHRGILPLFWIYYHDDHETGVTIHWADEGADTGDIILQDALPLPRGYPVESLNLRNARQGGDLLRSALLEVERGTAARGRQDHSRATSAPMIKPGARMVDFDHWDVERVWHFLAGLVSRFREPLLDEHGAAVDYTAAPGFDRQAEAERPGTVSRRPGGALLHCRGGVVYLDTRGPVRAGPTG